MVVKTGLRTEGLMSPAACQSATSASPKPSGVRTWLVIVMMTRSPVGVVAAAGNDDGGPLLRARLVRERKRHQNHIAEEMRHRYIRS